jgi:hypothetical protein
MCPLSQEAGDRFTRVDEHAIEVEQDTPAGERMGPSTNGDQEPCRHDGVLIREGGGRDVGREAGLVDGVSCRGWRALSWVCQAVGWAGGYWALAGPDGQCYGSCEELVATVWVDLGRRGCPDGQDATSPSEPRGHRSVPLSSARRRLMDRRPGAGDRLSDSPTAHGQSRETMLTIGKARTIRRVAASAPRVRGECDEAAVWRRRCASGRAAANTTVIPRPAPN